MDKKIPPGTQQIIVNVQQAPPSQALPALVSLFFPGIGQLIQGRLIAAILWFCIECLSILACFVLIGFLTTPLVCIFSAIDAARYAPTTPQRARLSLKNIAVALVWLIVLLFVLGLVFQTPDNNDNVRKNPKLAQVLPPAMPEAPKDQPKQENQEPQDNEIQNVPPEVLPDIMVPDENDATKNNPKQEDTAESRKRPNPDFQLMREWTSASGKNTFQGRLVGVIENDWSVVFIKENGKSAKYHRTIFSQKDIDFIDQSRSQDTDEDMKKWQVNRRWTSSDGQKSFVGFLVGQIDQDYVIVKKDGGITINHADSFKQMDRNFVQRNYNIRTKDKTIEKMATVQNTVVHEKHKDDNSTVARVMGQDFVKKHLKYPHDASFSWGATSDPVKIGNRDGWKVSGKVAAKNTFGAKLTFQYTVFLACDENGKWHLHSIEGIE